MWRAILVLAPVLLLVAAWLLLDTGGPDAAGGWTCDTVYYDSDDGCDCGCGVLDPDCGGGGCETPGCEEAMCEYCWPGGGECGKCKTQGIGTE